MSFDELSTLVALLAALGVAAERLVEIIKNMWPFLRDEQKLDRQVWFSSGNDKTKAATLEGIRKVTLQVLTIGACFATVLLAWPAIAGSIPGAPPEGWSGSRGWFITIAIAVLASGGSIFWYRIVGYVGAVRDARDENARKAAAEKEEKKLQTLVEAQAQRNNLPGAAADADAFIEDVKTNVKAL